jgi:hypothetical protein
MRSVSIPLLGIAVFALAGCSSVTVNYDFDPEYDFSRYETFQIYRGEGPPGDVLTANPLYKKRFETAAAAELKAKGFTDVDSDPDFVVVLHAGVKDKVHVSNMGSAGFYDPWWGPYGGNVTVSQYEEGTLVIDIVDMGKRKADGEKELAWRGTGSAVVGDPSRDAAKEQEKANRYVASILANFPPAPKR